MRVYLHHPKQQDNGQNTTQIATRMLSHTILLLIRLECFRSSATVFTLPSQEDHGHWQASNATLLDAAGCNAAAAAVRCQQLPAQKHSTRRRGAASDPGRRGRLVDPSADRGLRKVRIAAGNT